MCAQINIWGPIFDRCFQSVPAICVIRYSPPATCSIPLTNGSSGESPCMSSLGTGHEPAVAGILGTKFDGLIKHGNLEYGAVIDSTQDDWETDSTKLVTVMCDQIKALARRVGENEQSRRALRCVGFLTNGELAHNTQQQVRKLIWLQSASVRVSACSTEMDMCILSTELTCVLCRSICQGLGGCFRC